MDDATSGLIRLSFNPQLRVEFRGATVTSDAGLLLRRERRQTAVEHTSTLHWFEADALAGV